MSNVYWRAAARQYELLKAQHMDTAMFRRLVLDVAARIPQRLDRAGLTPRQESARARIVARRNRLTYLWEHGAGHSGDGSMYEAYNGTVEPIDHDFALWRVRGPRTGGLLDGRLAETKNRVLAALLNPASAD